MANSKHCAIVVFVAQVMMFTLTLLAHPPHEGVTDGANNAALALDASWHISKAASTMLHIDLAILMLSTCQSLVWVLHHTTSRFIAFEDVEVPHKLLACFILVFSLIHAGSQWAIFGQNSFQRGFGTKGFALVSLSTGVGWSGHIIILMLLLRVVTTVSQRNMTQFWSLLGCGNAFSIVLLALWAAHSDFCVPDRSLETFTPAPDVFWKFWVAGATLYLIERVILGIWVKQKTQISKVIQHPNDVIELQFGKMALRPTAGQYVLILCPSISLSEKRCLFMTSAPEDDYLSVHLHCNDEFSRQFAAALGCTVARAGLSTVVSIEKPLNLSGTHHSTREGLPQIYVNGPFGSTSGHVFEHTVAILVAAGAEVTPFASILKSIWYRMNHPRQTTRVQKVYFFWICHDFESFEWFRSLLMAIESQDRNSLIEIYLYLTAPFDEADATKNMINSTVHGTDIMTGLRAPTRHGHPDWDDIFFDIAQIHAPVEAGVFYRGPPSLGVELEHECKIAPKGVSEVDVSFIFKGSDF